MASLGPAPRPSARLRLRWLLAVLAVIVVLTAGWPLVSAMVAGHRPLAAGTSITVGPTRASSGRVTVGSGWSVLTASSNPHQNYAIGRGPERMSVQYVGLPRGGTPRALWRGMQQVLRIGNPGLTPGQPRVITTADGSRGLIAPLSGPGHTGRAAVVEAPSGRFAIEMIMVGPSNSPPVARASGLPIIKSLRFSAGSP